MRNDVLKRCRVIYERGPILKWFNFPCSMFLVRVVRRQFVSDQTYYISLEIVFKSEIIIIIIIFDLNCLKYQFNKFILKYRLKKNSYYNFLLFLIWWQNLILRYLFKFTLIINTCKRLFKFILILCNSNYICNNYFDMINRNYKL